MSDKTARRSLKVNFVYNFISQILTLIVPLITTPYVARVLNPDGIGQYSFSLSIITYFTLFANLGFDLYGQRQIAACSDNQEEKSRVFWELFVLKSFFSIASLAVLYSVVFTVGFGENYTLLILILSIQVIAVPFDIQFLFRGEENFKSIAIRTILMRVIGLACIFIFVRGEGDTWIYVLCLSASIIFSNIVMWPSIFRRIKLVKPKELKLLRHLKPSFLIFLPTLAVTLYSVFDKTMIGLLAQNADYENGCYEQAYKLNGVALLPVTIISSVMVSRNAYDYSRGDTESLKEHIGFAINYVWMMGLPLIAGFAVLSGNLSSWFLGAKYDYNKVSLLLRIMSVRFILSGFGEVFGNQLFIAIGKERYPLIATSVAAAVNLILNYFLIPIYGSVGAAIATAVCEFAVTAVLILLAVIKKHITIFKLFKNCWKYLIAAAAMFGILYLMQSCLSYGIWTFLLITFTGIVFYAFALFVLRDKFFLGGVKNAIAAVKAKLKPVKENSEESQNNDVETKDV